MLAAQMVQGIVQTQSEQGAIMDDDSFMLGWTVGMLTCFVILKLSGAI